MGSCMSVDQRPPSAMQCCVAFEEASRGARCGVWEHLTPDEVEALAEIVCWWCHRMIDGPTARLHFKARVLRGLSGAGQMPPGGNLEPGQASGPAGGSSRSSQPGRDQAGGATASSEAIPNLDWGRTSSSSSSRRNNGEGLSSPPSPLDGLFGQLRREPDDDQQTHDVFATVDAVFMSSAFENAHRFAMRELGLTSMNLGPSDVRATFRQKAGGILQAASNDEPSAMCSFFELVKLCFCVEVLRQLKGIPAARTPAGVGNRSLAAALAGAPGAPSRLAGAVSAGGLSPRRVRSSTIVSLGQTTTLSASSGSLSIRQTPVSRTVIVDGGGGDGHAEGLDLLFVMVGRDSSGGFRGGPSGTVMVSVSPLTASSMRGRLSAPLLQRRVETLLAELRQLDGAIAASRRTALTTAQMDECCPVKTCTEADAEGTCPICLEVTTVGEEVRTLPCGHIFHRGCSEAWLGTADTCPSCRHKIAISSPVMSSSRANSDDDPASIGGTFLATHLRDRHEAMSR
eukprot:TRINITY_DN121555_c0_g1_i1.p1 TRINITY_DN121555_c0_g1~~TRINITY_DN121555_c0_g1_i1.p1  ORF type:complete len:513 (+),score=58.71 TRINITY_DN121555_c0_g1_i1:94-1632(+)